jgi:hypothetical protein
MTYIPNKIGIPTHWADLGYHRKRECQQPFMRSNHASWFGVTESRHFKWHDLFMRCANSTGMIGSTWHDRCHCGLQSCHDIWRDSFMSHVICISATEKGQIWKKKFVGFICEILFKKAKIGKIVTYLFILHCLHTTCSWRTASVTIARGIDHISTKADSSACRYRQVIQAVPTDNNLYRPDSLAGHPHGLKQY